MDTMTSGGTLIFSYIRRFEPFLGVQNFEFQYFWGLEDCVDILGRGGGVIEKLD